MSLDSLCFIGCPVVSNWSLVYALYHKSWSVGIPLLSLFAGQVIIVILFAPKSVYNITYNRVCDTTYTHPSFMFFAWVDCVCFSQDTKRELNRCYRISVWITHFTMALLTAAKNDLRKLGVPVVRVVTRDGAWILVVICCSLLFSLPICVSVSWLTPSFCRELALFGAIVPYSYAIHIEKAHIVFGYVLVRTEFESNDELNMHYIFTGSWPISILSICVRPFSFQTAKPFVSFSFSTTVLSYHYEHANTSICRDRPRAE